MKPFGKIRLAALLAFSAAGLWAKNAQGVVTDSAGAPVAGATVLLKGESDSSVRSYITKDDGSFSFVGLSPDLYYNLKARVGQHESGQVTITRYDKSEEKKVQLKFDVPAQDLK